jgi:hypothetical protein
MLQGSLRILTSHGPLLVTCAGGTGPATLQSTQTASSRTEVAVCTEEDPQTGRQVCALGLPVPGVHGLGQVQVGA